MKKIKSLLNNKIFVFILGGLLFSVVSVYAVTYFPSNQVTYDNSSSKLNSTNVQGAIDELYKTCQAASSVSSGDYIYFYLPTNNVDTQGFYRIPINGGTATKIQESGDAHYIFNAGNSPIVIY